MPMDGPAQLTHAYEYYTGLVEGVSIYNCPVSHVVTKDLLLVS
jgi:hypothetical protein